MKEIEYKKIADELEECVKYAMGLKVRIENPEGKKETFQIGNISIALLNYQHSSVAINNGISTEIVGRNEMADMRIRIWIKNDVKTVRTDFAYGSIMPDPTYIKIFFRSVIHSCIKPAIAGFFGLKVKDNKYSSFSEAKPVVDDKQPIKMEEFTKDGLKQIEDTTRWLYKHNNILSASSTVAISRKAWIVCDSHGTKVIETQDNSYITIRFDCLSKKKILVEEHFADHFRTFQELVDSLGSVKIKITKKLSKIEMKRIESGIYPILLKASAVSTLFHEAVAGHMLSAKYILNGQSTVFEHKLGKRFAKKGMIPVLDEISIHDKPLESEMIASYRYDMEGSPAKNICLLERGVVRNYLTDKNTAARLKQESNGHYLAQSFTTVEQGRLVAVTPEPRISNLVIESHSDIDLQELQEAILNEFDFYLEIDSRSGMVFIETGTFDLEASSVTKIYRDGRREAIYPGTLSSNMTDFLATIQAVSNHYGEAKGFCGSSSGYVPTHEKAPVMFLHGINFVSDPKQEKFTDVDPVRDKFVPENF